MPRERYPLTAKIQSDICAFIRAGSFPHVAAEAAGVPTAVFEKWLDRGKRPLAKVRYKAFHDAVMQASAQARLAAEVAAHKDDPIAWLKHGPGKERQETKGWTTTVKPVHKGSSANINVLLDPGMQGLFATILQVLAPYPEARAAIAGVLAGGKPGPHPEITMPLSLPHPGEPESAWPDTPGTSGTLP